MIVSLRSVKSPHVSDHVKPGESVVIVIAFFAPQMCLSRELVCVFCRPNGSCVSVYVCLCICVVADFASIFCFHLLSFVLVVSSRSLIDFVVVCCLFEFVSYKNTSVFARLFRLFVRIFAIDLPDQVVKNFIHINFRLRR